MFFILFQWENHSKSLKLEEQHLKKVSKKITGKVMNSGSGTWIDWQYLLDSSELLAKCRYTLQYTYPFAYYMEPGSRKELVSLKNSQTTHFYIYKFNILILCIECWLVVFVLVWVPAGVPGGRNRELVVENWACREHRPRRPREPNGRGRKAAVDAAQRLPQCMIR